MEKVFDNPSKLESLVKQKYGFPEFIMMENAALAIKNLILEQKPAPDAKCLILCGKGNNGGDGYALARLISGHLQPLLFTLEPPAASEAKAQYDMCRKMGIKFVSAAALSSMSPDFIVDCLYGTGFKGELSPKVQKIIDTANKSKAIRIACDIPTALAFDAHYTVTMGEHKLALFSDKAKQVCGQIITAPLGVDPELFEKHLSPAAFLINSQDMKLPFRTNKAAHKGTYGHTAVMTGEKAGAAIICATAAMNFGSGLTSLIRCPDSNLVQFKISPELMISEPDAKGLPVIPAKTTCVVYGPGIQNVWGEDLVVIGEWFAKPSVKAPAAVFDAGVFGDVHFADLLSILNLRPDARIVLTPHLLELTRLCNALNIFPKLTVQELADNPETKIKVGKKINSLLPNTTLVIKSANTFIADKGQTYIITDGTPSLAKGGSGDVLAGLIASLLAQGYTPKDAAVTACQAHALAAKKTGASTYALTPVKLIKAVSSLK